jgi:hypothetical protein
MDNKKNHSIKASLIILMLTIGLCAQAASYVVYSVVGDVKIFDGKKNVTLTARKSVTDMSKLIIDAESAVTVLDEVHSKMYSFTTPGTNTVKQLIAKAKAPKNLSKQYLSYMVKQLFSKESKNLSHPSTYMQATATSYRATSKDSFLLNKLEAIFMKRSGNSVESSLIQPQNKVESDLDVRFELISCATGLPVDRNVDVATSCYIRVTNSTDDPLYVNVLDVDAKGNKYLVLPVDEAATCSHLFVPGNSTVSFKAEPFEFSEPKSKETFLLIATEEPVDFSILMNPIRGNGGSTMKSGIYRMFYETK